MSKRKTRSERIKVEQKSSIPMEEIVIEVDQITSGKINIISFCRNNKQIDTKGLKLKKRCTHPQSEYEYKHHWNYEDLIWFNKHYPVIVPYDGGDRTQWNNHIKRDIERLIRNEELVFIKKTNDGGKYRVKLIWVNT